MKKIIYQIDEDNLHRLADRLINFVPKSETTDFVPYNESDQLTQNEAAKYLNVTVTTLITWRKKIKDFPHLKYASKILYSKKLLTDFKYGIKNV